jgi:hypothetical protein
MKRMSIIVSMVFIVIFCGYNAALALPISVEYTYEETFTGSGNYTFDFTIMNNTDPIYGQHIYRFDLNIPTGTGASFFSAPDTWEWGTTSETYSLKEGDPVSVNYYFRTTTSNRTLAPDASLSGFSIPNVFGIPDSIEFVALTSSVYSADYQFATYGVGDDNVARSEFNFDFSSGFAGDAQLFTTGDPGDDTDDDTPAPAPVPEPSTFLLLGGGIAGLALVVRRRRKE